MEAGKDDFYIRLKIFMMFAEILHDAIDRQDTTYLSLFLNDMGLCDVAMETMDEYYSDEKEALLAKLVAAREIGAK